MSYLGHMGKKKVANGGGYQILPMPPTPAPPTTNGGTVPAPTTTPATGSDPLAGIMGMLDGEVMGIPVKYLAIAAVAYFLMKK